MVDRSFPGTVCWATIGQYSVAQEPFPRARSKERSQWKGRWRKKNNYKFSIHIFLSLSSLSSERVTGRPSPGARSKVGLTGVCRKGFQITVMGAPLFPSRAPRQTATLTTFGGGRRGGYVVGARVFLSWPSGRKEGKGCGQEMGQKLFLFSGRIFLSDTLSWKWTYVPAPKLISGARYMVHFQRPSNKFQTNTAQRS